MPLEIPCKYDSSHGRFSNPTTLRLHYQREHADAHVVQHGRRVMCAHCGKDLAESSVILHVRKAHNINTRTAVGHMLLPGQKPPEGNPTGRGMSTVYECLYCHREMSPNNVGRHVLKAHHQTDWRAHVRDLGKRPVDTDKGWTAEDTPTTAMVAAHVGKLDDRPHDAAHGHDDGNHPWHVDDIVMPVVEQLAQPSGMVPVAHLIALFAWRDATAAMLQAVTTRTQ